MGTVLDPGWSVKLRYLPSSAFQPHYDLGGNYTLGGTERRCDDGIAFCR